MRDISLVGNGPNFFSGELSWMDVIQATAKPSYGPLCEGAGLGRPRASARGDFSAVGRSASRCRPGELDAPDRSGHRSAEKMRPERTPGDRRGYRGLRLRYSPRCRHRPAASNGAHGDWGVFLTLVFQHPPDPPAIDRAV